MHGDGRAGVKTQIGTIRQAGIGPLLLAMTLCAVPLLGGWLLATLASVQPSPRTRSAAKRPARSLVLA